MLLIGVTGMDSMFWDKKLIAVKRKFNWNVIIHNFWFNDKGKLEHDAYTIPKGYEVCYHYGRIMNASVVDCRLWSYDNDNIACGYYKLKTEIEWDKFRELNFYFHFPREHNYNIKHFNAKVKNGFLIIKYVVDLNNTKEAFWHYLEITDNQNDKIKFIVD